MEKIPSYFIRYHISYIYIYIYSNPQTDFFVITQLLSVARQTGHFKLGLNPPNFTLDMVSNSSSISVTHVSSRIILFVYMLGFRTPEGSIR